MKEEGRKMKVGSRKWKKVVFLALFLLSACASGEGIEAHEAWVRTALKGENSAIYLILHNHTTDDDALVRVSTDVAEAVELHFTEVTNDVMQMSPVDKVQIPAGDEVEFKSGSYHIMLIGLKQDLNVGDEITVTFHFEKYQETTITIPVQDSAGESHTHP